MTSSESPAGKIAWHRRIGNRIVLSAILAAVIPLLLLGGTITIKVRHDLVRQTVASQKTLTATLLHGIDSLFQNYRRLVETIASLPALQSMRSDLQQPVVQEFLDQQRIFFGCSIYDRHGKTTVNLIRNQKSEAKIDTGLQLDLRAQNSLSEGFRQVLATHRPAFVADETSGYQEKMLFVMVPITDFADAEQIVGVVSCSISVAGPGIHEIIGGFPIEKTDILLLLDRTGGLISAQGNLPEGLRGLTLPGAATSLPESVLVDFGKTAYFGTLASVPEFSGFLLVARPRQRVLEFLNQLLLDLAIMLLVAFAIAVAVGFFMSRSMAEAIGSLVDAIRGVANGVVSQRVEVRGNDELSEAAYAFNEMLNTLEKHRMMDDIWHREWESAKKSQNLDSKTR